MRIVAANNFHYVFGGCERVFFNEMDLLQAHGHEVAPFSRMHEKNASTEYSGFFASPIEFRDIPFLRKLSTAPKVVYSFECRERFGELLDAFRPDVVHSHNSYARLTTSIFDAAKRRGVPVVMTVHDYKLVCPTHSMYSDGRTCERCLGGGYYNCILKRCHKGSVATSLVYTVESYFNRLFDKFDTISRFICPSKFMLSKLAEAGFPEEKLIHLPYMAKLEETTPSYENKGYVLYAGMLLEVKGIMTLLKAVRDVDVMVKIAGDGPFRPACEEYVRENSMKNVVFEGHRSGEELATLYRDAAFTVVPSEWYENYPMAVIEAFAAGKPVIGSDMGGIPELVVDGETGLRFRAGDVRDLGEKIRYLLSNPSLVRQLGVTARRKVEEDCDPSRHLKGLMDIYAGTLVGRGGCGSSS